MKSNLAANQFIYIIFTLNSLEGAIFCAVCKILFNINKTKVIITLLADMYYSTSWAIAKYCYDIYKIRSNFDPAK